MQSLLDIISATIIGGLLLIIMFSSIMTIQENTRVLRNEMELIDNLEFVSSLIGNYYMGKIGYENPSTNIIQKAESNQFWFRTKLDDGDDTIYLVKIYTGYEDPDRGYPLTIFVENGQLTDNIWLAEPINFSFFDNNGNELDSSVLADTGGRQLIRSVQVTISVFHGVYNSNKMYVRELVFQQYFPNLAL